MTEYNIDELQTKLSKYPFGVQFEEVPYLNMKNGYRKWVYKQGVKTSRNFDTLKSAVIHAALLNNLIKE